MKEGGGEMKACYLGGDVGGRNRQGEESRTALSALLPPQYESVCRAHCKTQLKPKVTPQSCWL